MNRKAFEVFEKICAEEDLKEKTTSYLREEIERRARRKKFLWLRKAVCFSCLVVLFLCGGLFYRAYITPVAYIDFDVNPSVEFRVNRFGRVIASHAYNDDGGEILAYVNVNHLSYSEAVKCLLGAMNEGGYFEQDTLLCVTVQTDKTDRESSMIQNLWEIVRTSSRESGYDIPADIYAVTEEVKHCARECELSPAKYLAIEGLIKVDPETDFEACRQHSVHELREMTREKCQEGGQHYGNHGQTEHEIEHGEGGGKDLQEWQEHKENHGYGQSGVQESDDSVNKEKADSSAKPGEMDNPTDKKGTDSSISEGENNPASVQEGTDTPVSQQKDQSDSGAQNRHGSSHGQGHHHGK